MKNLNVEINTRLAELRTDNDKTQKDIAQILNVSLNSYTKWERELRDIPLEKINELANYYGVSLDYLLGMSKVKEYSGRKNIDLELMHKRIKVLRESSGKKQFTVGEEIGFGQALYSYYESGKRIPKTFKLQFIAIYYNVSFDYLVGRSDIKN